MDPTGQLSNPSSRRGRLPNTALPQLRTPNESPGTKSAPRRKQVRLPEEEQAELVARHKAGAFKKELAQTYGAHVETVGAVVKRQATVLPEKLDLPASVG